MAVFERWFKQDLFEPVTVYNCGDVVFTEDNMSCLIGVNLYRGGDPVNLAECTMVANVIRADSVTVKLNGSVEGNKVWVTLPKEALAIPGRLGIMFQVINGRVMTTVYKVVMFAVRSSTDEILDPDSVIPDVSDIIAMFDDMEAASDRANAAALNAENAISYFADSFDPLEPYNAGDYVLYNGAIYKFISDHAAGSWDSTEVELIPNVSSEVKSLRAEIDQIADSVAEDIQQLEDLLAEVDLRLATKFDNAYLTDGYEYFEADGTMVVGPLGPFAGGGGGGGGGGGDINFSATNTSGWLTKTIAEGASCSVSFNWHSLENDIPTGNGSLKIVVGTSTKATLDIAQGDVTVDVSRYLTTGSNTVIFTVSDVYGNSRPLRFTVTTVVLKLESSFNPYVAYPGAISFPYVPTGNVTKTTYFILDGVTIGSASTATSGRQQNFTIPTQEHGSHTFQVYFEAVIDEQTVRSNELYYDLICTEEGYDEPIIASDFRGTSVPKYSTVDINFIAYDPTSLNATVEIYVNDTFYTEQTVDRTLQTFTYRALETGDLSIKLLVNSPVSSEVEKSFYLQVTASEYDIEAETEDLALYLSSYGRSNNDANRSVWTYENISATLLNFNWTSDGWQRDESGAVALRVAGDARVYIPYQIFANDFRGTGKTIEIEFATRQVMDYDAVIMSCFSGGRGFKMTAQSAKLNSEQSEISMQFKENEHVRVAFVVEKRTENRLIYCYINGIMSGVVRYPDDDDFQQNNPVDISIGNNNCTIDIYCIRVYDNDLTRYQILGNWIADTQDVELMVARYLRNDIYDAYGSVIIGKLPSDLPYMVVEAAELPQYKGDKKTLSGSYTDPVQPSKSFTFTGAQWDVQGTSSQYYARKNYKAKYKNGIILPDGTIASKYQLANGEVPVNVFCYKADVASSEGANNVELARLYNAACPYKTPAQIADPRVKQGIDGYPCVMFWDNNVSTSFLGKYNFNIDKGAEDFFGFEDGDESWEVRNNTGNRVIFKSADYSGTAWLNDFEARYPDTDPPYEDPAQLKEFAEWIVTTDVEAATGNALPESVTYRMKVVTYIEHEDPETGAISYEEVVSYEDQTFTTDSAEYRIAKFRNELENYVELDSALFYYLFTELFLMVDSRAKNMFPSFIGTEIIGS